MYSYTNNNIIILIFVHLILFKWHIYLCKRDKLQDLNINQLKLEVLDTYEKDEKITTNFELVNDEDVVNKAYLDENLKKIDGHISYIEKVTTSLNYNTTNKM